MTKKKQTVKYEVKKLVEGRVIRSDGFYVAIPDTHKGFIIEVIHKGEKMMINNWLRADAYRKFPDQYGRKDEAGNTKMYTLAYFRWSPEMPESGSSPIPFEARTKLSEMWRNTLKKKEEAI